MSTETGAEVKRNNDALRAALRRVAANYEHAGGAEEPVFGELFAEDIADLAREVWGSLAGLDAEQLRAVVAGATPEEVRR
jgi:hypothetical protein